MKHQKWLMSFPTLSLALTSGCFVLTCCNNNEDEPEPSDETPQDYIYNRTFSIACENNQYDIFGTCWIINDATPNKNDDYIYNVATNWHVTHGFDLLEGTKTYYIADDSLTTRSDHIIDISKYIHLEDYYQYPDTNFVYSDDPKTDYFEASIDLHTCKINFGSLPKGKIKNKLDFINKYQKEHGYITRFANAQDRSITNQTKYMGGYPMKKSGSTYGGRWEVHSIKANALNYFEKDHKYDDVNKGHAIGTPDVDQQGNVIVYEPGTETEEWYNYDVSSQYMSKDIYPMSWMSGGASGSMLITKDCQVCGIYWGGWSDEEKFWPSFSLFKTNDYDFTSEWLNTEK